MIKNHRMTIGCSSVLIVVCSTVGLIISCMYDMPVNLASGFMAIFAIVLMASIVAVYNNYKDIDYDKKLSILYSIG